jgi:PmbA protein
MNHAEIAARALAAVRRAGCEGEVFLEDGRSTKVAVSGGRVESLEERIDRGAGVRVFDRGRAGFSFTGDLSDAGLEAAVARAREIAELVAADPANRLPEDPGEPAPGLDLADPGLAAVPIARKIEIARAAEASARAADPRISGVREAAYQDATGTYWIENTAGLRRTHTQTRAVVAIELAATQDGEAQTGWQGGWKTGAEGLDPAAVGKDAARKAVAKLGASPAATGRTAVVLSPEVTASLFGELSALFAMDAVLKGRSLLAGKEGERIGSDAVTLVDDGRHPLGYATTPVDGEGVASRETTLLEKGILRSYLTDGWSSAKSGKPLTGNGLRGGYGVRPMIGRTNLCLRPTGGTASDLLARAGAGVYITEVMGLHTVNAVTGDFSIGASGLAIESGRLGGAVDRMAIAGNILGLLDSVLAVADDLQFLLFGPGNTVLLGDIAVSGR